MKVSLILIVQGLLLFVSAAASAQVSVDEQRIGGLVQRCRLLAEAKISDAEVRADFAPNYVHITAGGQMTVPGVLPAVVQRIHLLWRS